MVVQHLKVVPNQSMARVLLYSMLMPPFFFKPFEWGEKFSNLRIEFFRFLFMLFDQNRRTLFLFVFEHRSKSVCGNLFPFVKHGKMNAVLRRNLTDRFFLFQKFQNYLRFECCRVMFSHKPMIAYMTPFSLSDFLDPLYATFFTQRLHLGSRNFVLTLLQF